MAQSSLAIISTFRTILAEMLTDHVDGMRLRTIRQATSTASTMVATDNRCLYMYLRYGNCGNKSTWTREHRRLYACKTCVNKQRLCMIDSQDQIIVLPLHPLLRAGNSDPEVADEMLDHSLPDMVDADVRPTELGYWVASQSNSTIRSPYNRADIWAVSTGGQS